jgi:hypothetical protein
MNLTDLYQKVEDKRSKINQDPRVVIYFHEDFDGVVSALGVKCALNKYGLTNIVARKVQYGDHLTQIAPNPNDLNILVDFADGFEGTDLHTDHHHGTYSPQDGGIKAFYPAAKSNGAVLWGQVNTQLELPNSHLISPLIKAVNCIDSAGYAKLGFTTTEQRTYLPDLANQITQHSNLEPQLKHYFALNKILLAFKSTLVDNKSYLETFVEKCQTIHPIEMVYGACQLAFQANKKPYKDKPSKKAIKNTTISSLLNMLQENGDEYQEKFKQEMQRRIEENPSLLQTSQDKKQILYIDHTKKVAPMFRGAYDRYAAFEQFPQITYLINNWGAMGLVQASYNPNAQTKDRNMLEITTKALQATKEHFGDNHQASMQYFRNLIRGDNSTIPRIKPRTDLLETLLGKQATQILANKQLLNLSQEELSELSFNPWTLVEQTKGGHIPIANLPHLAVFADDRKAITTHLVEQILKTLSN